MDGLPAAANSDEVQVLRLKKHFNLVLFRLSSGMSMGDYGLQHSGCVPGSIGMRERASALAHAL